eukprot:11934222-Ditylum_brightwellii.AAC.1
MGIFDGHGTLGHAIATYAATYLPQLLVQNLNSAFQLQGGGKDKEDEDAKIQKILSQTFLQMDEQILKLPKDTFDGGCTASLIFRYTPPLQQRQHHHHDNNKVYIANAGDSQTLVAAYVPSTKTVFLLYQSRMDKPHLPTEKSRIEKSGGSVYIPQDNGPGYLNETSRVWASKADGQMYGLAMSRSLGDGDSKLAGVIADPIVDVLDLNKMKKEVRKKIASGGDDH